MGKEECRDPGGEKKRKTRQNEDIPKGYKPNALAENARVLEVVMSKAKFILKILFVLQMATDDDLQASDAGTTEVCHLKEIPVFPDPWSCCHGDDNGNEYLRTVPHELQVER